VQFQIFLNPIKLSSFHVSISQELTQPSLFKFDMKMKQEILRKSLRNFTSYDCYTIFLCESHIIIYKDSFVRPLNWNFCLHYQSFESPSSITLDVIHFHWNIHVCHLLLFNSNYFIIGTHSLVIFSIDYGYTCRINGVEPQFKKLFRQCWCYTFYFIRIRLRMLKRKLIKYLELWSLILSS